MKKMNRKWMVILLSLGLIVTSIVVMNQNKNEEIHAVSKEENEALDHYQKLTTDEFLKRSEEVKVIDTRQSDAYNGWDLDVENTGGHIENSINFSSNWLMYDDGNNLNDILIDENISVENELILVDTDIDNAKKIANFFKKKGYDKMTYYQLTANSKNEGIELIKYPNYHMVVPAQMVKAVIDGQVPETFKQDVKVKIVEASWGESHTSYDNGHIPTAFHINTDLIEPPAEQGPPMWMLANDEMLVDVYNQFGFKEDETVIVTGEEQMAAYRVASILKYLGVKDVRVLNGGTTAWKDAGYELSKEPVMAVSNETYVTPNVLESVIVTTDELKAMMAENANYTLVDNRTREEYDGESSGYSYHEKMGRIPGAKYGYAGTENAYSLSVYRNPDKTMKYPEHFIKLWESETIDVDEPLVFMCGSGWRAAEIYYYANVLGLEDTSIYSDGWIGWSNLEEK